VNANLGRPIAPIPRRTLDSAAPGTTRPILNGGILQAGGTLTDTRALVADRRHGQGADEQGRRAGPMIGRTTCETGTMVARDGFAGV
jgi:hypothetical protein